MDFGVLATLLSHGDEGSGGEGIQDSLSGGIKMIKNTRASPYNKKRATQSRSPLPVRQATFPVNDTTTQTNLHNIRII